MPRAKLEMKNARSRVQGLSSEVYQLLSHELSYPVADPGVRAYPQADGSIKTVWWDGYRRLLARNGVFPSGLVPRVVRLLAKWDVGVQVEDLRVRPEQQIPRWSLPSSLQLRDYQRESCRRAYELGRGTIDSPPRTGKTVMMAELVRMVSGPTVVTAPTRAIAKQTYKVFLDLFAHADGWSGLGPVAKDFYLLVGGKPKNRKQQLAAKRALVFIGTADTAVTMPESWWEAIECLIVDERHHQAAKTYHQINDLAKNAFYRWGFTGTNYRSNPSEIIALEAALGETVASFTVREMTARGVLAPGRVEFWPNTSPVIGDRVKFNDVYRRGVAECTPRNNLIAAAADYLRRDGRKTLILVHRLEHGRRLANLIPGSRFVSGEDGDEVAETVRDLDAGRIWCVIGSPVVGEGLDVPSADGLIYAKSGKAKVTHVQDTFRVLTGREGKREALIIDFADRHNEKLADHSVERAKHYRELGLRVDIAAPDPVQRQQMGFEPRGDS